MTCECKRCGKLFEKFFCPECEELSIQKLAEMMEKELNKKDHNLSSSSSRAARCYPGQPEHIFDQHGFCMICGDPKPPPA